MKVAALFIDSEGPYAHRNDVDPWDEKRDARFYTGSLPVVAHPPCQRWGRYATGGPSVKIPKTKGDDNGCFAAAISHVRRCGGVLEHPADSAAWQVHGIAKPPRSGGWIPAGDNRGFTCCVYQGWYGHRAAKATWLYAVGIDPLPTLRWGEIRGQRLEDGFHSSEERAKARASGVKPVERLSSLERRLTPKPFAELLISMAKTAALCDHGKPIGHWCDGCYEEKAMNKATTSKECHGCRAPVRGGSITPCTICRDWCLCCDRCQDVYSEGSKSLVITRCAKYEDQMGRAIQLSAASVEHYGPDYMGNMVRAVFGGPINLDPASCPQANLLIGAERYYTETDNGMVLPWWGSVYLNPPGGRIRYHAASGELGTGPKVNSAALWYATLAHRVAAGLVTHAVFMVFNLELFRYAQDYKVRQPLEFPICFPKDRIDFWKPGPDGVPVPQGSPGHPNAVVYMGLHRDRFRDVFSQESGDWPGGRVYNV